ncbi:MAG: hypothetical protein OEW42_03370 [Acidimicrobiia bacterium]|nr:hypothetical protein [Acidimicrobiia bacterium]MDH5236618.1 hypothetical protein [Acidimicrobiia bacterium]
MTRRRLHLLGAALLVAGACSSSEPDSGSTSTTAAPASLAAPTSPAIPTTTAAAAVTSSSADPEVDPVSFQTAGPHEVGITTLALPTGNLVEVFYPADDTVDGQTDSYQVRSFLPEAIRALIPEETADRYEIEAARDGAASPEGPFPLVLFSHGAAAFRSQSTDLARHLASWGMVVASPDHPSRNLESQLSNSEVRPQPAADDLRATRELVTSAAEGPLAGLVDPNLVAVSGHSAGGGTTLEVATDDGIAGYVSYASGAFDDTELPTVPSLFMAGALDEIVEPERTAEAHTAAAAPSWLWVIEETGHLAFSDICAIGNDEGGLIGLAESAGIGDLVPAELRRLATDGCEPPNVEVTSVWPAVNQASVAFYRYTFGLDDEPRGLDAIDLDGVTVEIDERLS